MSQFSVAHDFSVDLAVKNLYLLWMVMVAFLLVILCAGNLSIKFPQGVSKKVSLIQTFSGN